MIDRTAKGEGVRGQGQCLYDAGQEVGWDQRRFAAPAHHEFATFPDGGLALEASWSHPTLNKAMALSQEGLQSLNCWSPYGPLTPRRRAGEETRKNTGDHQSTTVPARRQELVALADS